MSQLNLKRARLATSSALYHAACFREARDLANRNNDPAKRKLKSEHMKLARRSAIRAYHYINLAKRELRLHHSHLRLVK